VLLGPLVNRRASAYNFRPPAASRWVYVVILKDKSATVAGGFFKGLIAKALFTINTVLTDNGKEFTDRFDSAASLKATLRRFVYLYNYHIPQKNLHHKTPLRTLQQWSAQQPRLFKKALYGFQTG